MRRVSLALVALLTATLLSSCSDGDTSASDPSGPGADCTWGPAESPARDVTAPTAGSAPSATHAEVRTNQGIIGITLDSKEAPCTVLSLESLAGQHYFDDTVCHRLTVAADHGIGVLQCGDPTGTGRGGPGYTIPDELDTAQRLADAPTGPPYKIYPAGTVAMAKTSEPDSGGSQFFLVYEDSPLPPDYTVFGQMDEPGLAVVQQAAAAGYRVDATGGNTAPVTEVKILSLSTS